MNSTSSEFGSFTGVGTEEAVGVGTEEAVGVVEGGGDELTTFLALGVYSSRSCSSRFELF